MDLHGRGEVQVLTKGRFDVSPSYAPNGAEIIYATRDRGRGVLALVSADGRVQERLVSSEGDVQEPAWSPF
jgi:TolB protein